VAQSQVLAFDARFTSIVHVGDRLGCSGVITHKTEEGGLRRATVRLQAVDQHGDVKITGSAVVGF
jgi:acyl dehydratase